MLFELAEKAQKEVSKYCDDYEIYIDKLDLLQLDTQKSDLNFAKEENTLGLGIRVIKDGKIGFAFTSDMDKIDKTAKTAFENSKLNEKDENFAFALEEKLPKIDGCFDKKFRDLELEEITSSMKDFLAIVEDEGCQATSGGFSAAEGETLIINSNGVSAYDKSTGFGLGISVNAEANGEISTAYDSVSSCLFDLDSDKLALDVCKLAKNSLNGENIETADMDVIFDYHAAVGLLSTFLSGFSADSVQRGRSILADKIGQEIVSQNLSIYDDGTYKGGLNSGVSDGEGTASKRTTLVENGVLKNFLYDIYTANKANSLNNTPVDANNCDIDIDVIKSTANGFRSSYSGTPSVSSSNIIFDFKEKSQITDIKNGFIATDVLGAHTANPFSGDFSVEVNNGFKIINGEIGKGVKKAMISGNIYEILSDCEAIGEIKQRGSFIIPKLLVHNLRVIGN
ncbi:MAG: TldD/PmbA family protein [Methanobacteriaceae archaeon]|nr:TldD/PmbA family protein [Methanobacteriaceae archaeon]